MRKKPLRILPTGGESAGLRVRRVSSRMRIRLAVSGKLGGCRAAVQCAQLPVKPAIGAVTTPSYYGLSLPKSRILNAASREPTRKQILTHSLDVYLTSYVHSQAPLYFSREEDGHCFEKMARDGNDCWA